MAVTAGAGAAVSAVVGGLPDARELTARPLPSDTLVYDRTGKTLLADLHPGGYQHYEMPLSAMGRYLPAATVAVEDANFWSEPGVDAMSTARAAFADLRARHVVQGGSTITQQLVKYRLLGSDASVTRKVREAAMAVRVSGAYSKHQILELYLNSISYGNTAVGVAAAARIYFHREPAQLDLAQAALLAGVPQNPTLLDPVAHFQAAKQRQHDVLDAMVRVGEITREEADSAFAEDLSPPDHLFAPRPVNLYPDFDSYVASVLTERFGKDTALGGGLRVVTSLDVGLQQLAQRSVADAVRDNRERDVSDGAMVAMDPRNGQVLAMVGS